QLNGRFVSFDPPSLLEVVLFLFSSSPPSLFSPFPSSSSSLSLPSLLFSSFLSPPFFFPSLFPLFSSLPPSFPLSPSLLSF
ncbi:hypothetical protein ACXWRW_11110, partial [Streptococcus pyogenes]